MCACFGFQVVLLNRGSHCCVLNVTCFTGTSYSMPARSVPVRALLLAQRCIAQQRSYQLPTLLLLPLHRGNTSLWRGVLNFRTTVGPVYFYMTSYETYSTHDNDTTLLGKHFRAHVLQNAGHTKMMALALDGSRSLRRHVDASLAFALLALSRKSA